jgi:hypothetical protein
MGSFHLSDLIYSGPSASKTVAVVTSETYVGSFSEANSSINIKPAGTKWSTIDPHDEIMENFNRSSGSEESFNSISNCSEQDFMARYGSISLGTKDEWVSG